MRGPAPFPGRCGRTSVGRAAGASRACPGLDPGLRCSWTVRRSRAAPSGPSAGAPRAMTSAGAVLAHRSDAGHAHGLRAERPDHPPVAARPAPATRAILVTHVASSPERCRQHRSDDGRGRPPRADRPGPPAPARSRSSSPSRSGRGLHRARHRRARSARHSETTPPSNRHHRLDSTETCRIGASPTPAAGPEADRPRAPPAPPLGRGRGPGACSRPSPPRRPSPPSPPRRGR